MSIPADKAAADRTAEEEKMEIECGIRLLDASTNNISSQDEKRSNISSQDEKRSRVDSLSSHFIRVCRLGQSKVFEASDSYHPPPITAPLSSATKGLPHSYRMARTVRRNMMTATLAGVGPYSRKAVETGAGYSSGSFELPG